MNNREARGQKWTSVIINMTMGKSSLSNNRLRWHWGQGPVYQAGTLQVHCKEMDKAPCMYPPSTSQVHSEFSLPMFLQFPWPGEWPVHSQCPRSHDCNVPINYIMGTSWIFPKNVTVVFLSCSFKRSLQCVQCPRSCDWDVPIGKVMGTSWIFPKKASVMFLSGSFKGFFSVPSGVITMFPASKT